MTDSDQLPEKTRNDNVFVSGETPDDAGVNQEKLLESIAYCCLQVYLAISPVVKKQLEERGLRPVEYTVLTLVEHNPGISQKQLGQTIKVSPPNMATLLDRMEADGTLQRQRNPRDKRSHILLMTAHGKQLLNEAKDTIAITESDIQLNTHEREQLLGLLKKIFLP